MLSIKKVRIILLLTFTYLFSFAQESGLELINTDDLKRHLTFISSDSLQGRSLGTTNPGLDKAAQYLAENSQKIGLKAIGNSYFQKVELISTQPDNENFIEISNKNDKQNYLTQSLIFLNGSTEEKTLKKGKCILAGFGTGELGKQDIEGKIVIIAQGNVESYKKGNDFRWKNGQEREKFTTISKHNPEAIIIITNPEDKDNKTFSQIKVWFGRSRHQLKANLGMDEAPIIVALPKLADKLLGGKGKYESYLSSCADGKQPGFIEIENYNLNFKVGLKWDMVDAKNVIGIIEGSDPELKNECVVFMAHYDHLGVDKNGDVYNGADDNGSGTVTLLEVAEAFMSLEEKPKRSIVFLWVTAEEIGMLGSKYYAENPIYPLEKTVACINIDMDGRVYEPRDSVWNRSAKKVKDFDGLYTLTNDFWPGLKDINTANCEQLGLVPDYSLPARFLRSSDHFSFHNKGVPIINYATGYHADYHKVTDEISRINFEKMKRVADLCFLVGLEIANQEKIEIAPQ